MQNDLCFVAHRLRFCTVETTTAQPHDPMPGSNSKRFASYVSSLLGFRHSIALRLYCMPSSTRSGISKHTDHMCTLTATPWSPAHRFFRGRARSQSPAATASSSETTAITSSTSSKTRRLGQARLRTIPLTMSHEICTAVSRYTAQMRSKFGHVDWRNLGRDHRRPPTYAR